MTYNYAERVWYQASILILAFIPLIILANAMDSRALNDIPIWIKPLKFHVSTALHLLTFAILIRFLPQPTQSSKWLATLAALSAVATILELMLIDFQAARGVHSHFNMDTQFDGTLYGVMGVAALVLSLPALVLGIRFLFASTSEHIPPGLRLGAALGLTLGFVLTLGIAGYMSSLPGGHWVNAPATDSGGVPVFGWSRQGGDLRVPHFLATHLMQILPLIGFVLDKMWKDKVRKIYLAVMFASIVGVGATLLLLLQALAGNPFIG